MRGWPGPHPPSRSLRKGGLPLLLRLLSPCRCRCFSCLSSPKSLPRAKSNGEPALAVVSFAVALPLLLGRVMRSPSGLPKARSDRRPPTSDLGQSQIRRRRPLLRRHRTHQAHRNSVGVFNNRVTRTPKCVIRLLQATISRTGHVAEHIIDSRPCAHSKSDDDAASQVRSTLPRRHSNGC